MNKMCQIAGIRLLLRKNYKLQTDTIDLFALIDSTLTFKENWDIIKEKYLSERFCSCCGAYYGK